jgi:hypothetical protein
MQAAMAAKRLAAPGAQQGLEPGPGTRRIDVRYSAQGALDAARRRIHRITILGRHEAFGGNWSENAPYDTALGKDGQIMPSEEPPAPGGTEACFSRILDCRSRSGTSVSTFCIPEEELVVAQVLSFLWPFDSFQAP